MMKNKENPWFLGQNNCVTYPICLMTWHSKQILFEIFCQLCTLLNYLSVVFRSMSKYICKFYLKKQHLKYIYPQNITQQAC